VVTQGKFLISSTPPERESRSNIKMSLETIPDESLQRILYFVSDAQDFRSCELTCKKMQRIIRCDDQWKYCKGKWRGGVVTTNRDRACIHKNLGRIRETQRKDINNLTVGALSVNGWKKLVTDTIQCFRPHNNLAAYFLRGDTLAVIIEVMQFYMTEQLDLANRICIYRVRDNDEYPEISMDDYTLAERLLLGVQARPLETSFAQIFRCTEKRNVDDFPGAMALLGRSARDKIIRALALRAGVVKMTSVVYDLAWKSLVQLIIVLVTPACIELVDMSKVKSGRKRSLDTADMRMVPPPSLEQLDGILLYTPVPRQIQDAASRLGIGRVYGDSWLVCEGSTEEEEIAAAEAQYIIVKNEEGSSEEEYVSEEDDESRYEDSDIDFSEHEDDDCPDMLSSSDENDAAPICRL
jgi:hypothetical protein